jgi:putative endonuclease
MAKHLEKGKQGEDIACEYLIQQGYHIICRNWQLEKAEIDIIAMENKELVFVEVRLRTHAEDIPELSISNKKIELLCNAASYFADVHTELNYHTTRFDVIGIHVQKNISHINHYKDVFR